MMKTFKVMITGAVLFMALLSLIGCGETYVPGNQFLDCYVKDSNGVAIPGLQAILIRRSTGESVQTTTTDSDGFAELTVYQDQSLAYTSIAEIFQSYKITLTDPSGVYATKDFFPRFPYSIADITVVVLKN